MKDTIERRILSAVVAVAIMVTAIIPTAMIGGLASSVLVGDVNGDGEIDEIDASLILQHTAELITLSEEQLGRGDVNADSETDPIDAAFILMHSSGIKAIEQPSDHVHTKGKCINIRMSMSCDEQGYYTWICGICGEEWYEDNGVYHQWDPDRHAVYGNHAGWQEDFENYVATRTCYRCGYSETSHYTMYDESNTADVRDTIIDLINEERAKIGVHPLTRSTAVEEMAQIRAGEVMEKPSHTRPNGEYFSTIRDDCGYTIPCSIGETICVEHDNTIDTIAQKIFNGFMNSAPHRELLLRDEFTGVGIGCVGYALSHLPEEKRLVNLACSILLVSRYE